MSRFDSTARFRAHCRRAAMLVACGLLASVTWADGPQVLTGATVHTISGPAIENGIVIIEDGTIQAVGSQSDLADRLPADAERVDLAGKHLYPGMIHPLTTLGLAEIGSVRGTVDTNEVGDNNSDLRAEVAFNADSLRLPATTAGGVTHALVYQRGGLFSGTSALMRLQGWNWQDMAIQAPAGLHLWFPSRPDHDDDEDGEATAEAEKAMKALNEYLAQARAYQKAQKAGTRGLDADPKLERLIDLVNGELRLFVHARGKAEIGAALDWLQEQEITDAVLVAGYQARYAAERLAEVDLPVILNGVHVIPEKNSEPYDAAYGAAAALKKAGVRFCIGDGGGDFGAPNARNLPFQAAMAVAYGLDAEHALRAVTLDTAEILGVDDRLGSIEVGKEASLFVTNGDPLESITSVEQVWVAGRWVDPDRNHQYQLYQKYWNRPRPTD